MKIIVVGASGTIGKAVVAELGSRHDIIPAGRSGELKLDMMDTTSIKSAYEKVGEFDAVVSCAGHVKFAPFAEMQDEDYRIGINDKLMGQVNLVLLGRNYIKDAGSFTLTTGVLDHDPIPMGTSATMINGAVNGFTIASAIEMPRGIRINTVSPGVIEEAMESYAPFFRGHKAVPAADAALGYAKSVEGLQTGQVFSIA